MDEDPATKIEDEFDPTSTSGFPSAAESTATSKGLKSKSQSRDKASPASTASAKRRCVSTACIACRRRKSKVRSSFSSATAITYNHARADTDTALASYSVMGIRPAVLHAPPSMVPNAYTIRIPTIAVRVSTRRTLITSRLATPPSKPSSKPSLITLRMRYPTWSSR